MYKYIYIYIYIYYTDIPIDDLHINDSQNHSY